MVSSSASLGAMVSVCFDIGSGRIKGLSIGRGVYDSALTISFLTPAIVDKLDETTPGGYGILLGGNSKGGLEKLLEFAEMKIVCCIRFTLNVLCIDKKRFNVISFREYNLERIGVYNTLNNASCFRNFLNNIYQGQLH